MQCKNEVLKIWTDFQKKFWCCKENPMNERRRRYIRWRY